MGSGKIIETIFIALLIAGFSGMEVVAILSIMRKPKVWLYWGFAVWAFLGAYVFINELVKLYGTP